MATLTHAEIKEIEERHPQATRSFLRLRLAIGGALLVIIGFFTFLYYEFNVAQALGRYNYERLEIASKDMFSYKNHVVVDFRSPREIVVNQEGQRRAVFETPPDWVEGSDGVYEVDLGVYGRVSAEPGLITIEDGQGRTAQVRVGDGARADPVVLTPGAVRGADPDGWLDATATRVTARLGLNARVVVSRSRLEIQRYFSGWENFWFPFGHPLNGASFVQVMSAAFGDAPITDSQPADQSNIGHIWTTFLTNPEWQHGEIFEALWLTILMAALGTALATIIGLPLAFVAARNVNPITPLQFGVKKLFDVLRAVDTLIWSLIFIRGFGPGPLAGTLAIATTDTGTLGKLYSEAIENADKKQVEGVGAVGSGAIQKNWFGIFPQILPVFVSQGLYFLESNTRSATIIGILGAGGIGLKLADSMRTGRDWENTMYIILLIILVVIIMDNLSAYLRRRLIHGRAPELEQIIERQRANRGFMGITKGA